MTNKAKRLFLFGVGLLLGQCISPVYAAPILRIETQTPIVYAEQQYFSVDVVAADVTDLYAFQFDISFSTSSLYSVVDITEGPFLPNAGITFFLPGAIDNGTGTISFTADTLIGAASGVSGTGTLATIDFQTFPEFPGAATALISLSNVVLLDSNLAEISVSTIDGSVQVIPEPSALLLLGVSLGAMLLQRTRSADLRSKCFRSSLCLKTLGKTVAT